MERRSEPLVRPRVRKLIYWLIAANVLVHGSYVLVTR